MGETYGWPPFLFSLLVVLFSNHVISFLQWVLLSVASFALYLVICSHIFVLPCFELFCFLSSRRFIRSILSTPQKVGIRSTYVLSSWDPTCGITLGMMLLSSSFAYYITRKQPSQLLMRSSFHPKSDNWASWVKFEQQG